MGHFFLTYPIGVWYQTNGLGRSPPKIEKGAWIFQLKNRNLRVLATPRKSAKSEFKDKALSHLVPSLS